ncbi:Glycosyl hydrolase family 1 protein [Trichomonas vaginalis G3]|uniref:Glycosyl hydrolase family 1 protein n=1 Tax=Trichomonas vaginalis (strain ATCC PRA-98 / G3) TaxID=412133 RepID=A2F8L5_TRIV3|nr:glycosyl hydrolase [Trichomonas vaginalis G3]EAX98747.1 Glycosyl hydrolase family 1 protein [Trichomonas vaginalis G3]KAI5543503.1 beta-glucosidase protein [Trichomonas vaginalis G3]|eukprot:XP_001311677.1 glycosyl hydrolase [Trichomonas vaginalis G3]
MILALVKRHIPPTAPLEDLPEEEIKQLKFSKDFYFGTASSAYQVEDTKEESNWTRFSHQFNREGERKAPDHENACKAFENFDNDLQIMKDSKFNCYRFGLSWSDIEPKHGEFNDSYMQNYIEQCDKLTAQGIEPMITLFHFEYPGWIEDEKGLLSQNFHQYFIEFVEYTVTKLKGHCKYFFTINEPMSVSLMGYLGGAFPPGYKMKFRKSFLAVSKMLFCHLSAYKLIHQIIPESKVSIVNQLVLCYPKHKWSIIENALASAVNSFLNRPYMEALTTGVLQFRPLGIRLFKQQIVGLPESQDFISVNHYTSIYITMDPRDWNEFPMANRRPNKDVPLSDFSWSLIPSSLESAVRWVDKEWNPHHLPIFVTEHGLSDRDDLHRGWFTTQSLGYLKHAIDYGIPVMGYIHWSLLDNYEWNEGYKQHFGLVKVDFQSQERTPQKSLQMYKEIIERSV